MQIQLIIDDNMTSIKALIKNDDGSKIIKEIDSFQFLSRLKSIDFTFNSGLLPFQKDKNNLLGFKKSDLCNIYILHYHPQTYNLKFSIKRSSSEYETIPIDYPDIILEVKISNNTIINLNAYQCYKFNYFKPFESKLYVLQRPNIYAESSLCFGELNEEKNITPDKIPYLLDIVYRLLWNSIGNTDILPGCIYNYEYDVRTKNVDPKDDEKLTEISNYIDNNKAELMVKYFKEFHTCYPEKYAQVTTNNKNIKTLGDLFK